MVISHDCYHCHHYCYSHCTSLSKLQFAYTGLTLSVWAYVDICCKACLPVEWFQAQYFIHSPISKHFPSAGMVLGTGDAGTSKTCPVLTMVLVEGQQKRTTACCSFTPHVPPQDPHLPPRSVLSWGAQWSWALLHPSAGFLSRGVESAPDQSSDLLGYIVSANTCSSL